MPKQNSAADSEPTESKRGLALHLPPAEDERLRELSRRTRISIRELVSSIEESQIFEVAIQNILRLVYKGWKDSADGLFPEELQPKGESDGEK